METSKVSRQEMRIFKIKDQYQFKCVLDDRDARHKRLFRACERPSVSYREWGCNSFLLNLG